MRAGLAKLVVLLLAATSAAVVARPTPPAGAQAAARPNVLFIITDDQRRDSGMVVQPETLRRFAEGGTEFTNVNATTPLCCPSRGSFWSGRYAHNHGVRVNGSTASELAFDHAAALPSLLRANGYRTGMAGKFWTGWPISTPPPGYDRWANMSGAYVNERWNVDGTLGQVPGYTTDLVGSFAASQLAAFEANDAQPWFLYLSPYAPHTPYTPEPAYATAPLPPWNGNPAVAETDRSDKPPYLRQCCGSGLSGGQGTRADQLRTLFSVDEMVDAVFDEMDRLGETENTLAIYTSDNGFMWAEHGKIGKRAPYRHSREIPLYLRWPGHVTAGAADDRLAGNIDLAPTILEAVGIAPAGSLDGVSLFDARERDRLLLEYYESPDVEFPPWAATLTPTWQYTEWYDPTSGAIVFREYYDLANDPWELVNLLGDANPGNDPDVASLHDQLLVDRSCVGSSCPGVVVIDPDTVPPTPPGTPAGSSTVAGRIDLTWGASSDDRATTLTYRVFRDQETTQFATFASASTTTVSVADTGLAPGSTHTYRVTASDGVHTVSSGTSAPITVLVAPTSILTDPFTAGLGGWTVVRVSLDGQRGAAAPPSARVQVTNQSAYARRSFGATPSVCASAAVQVTSISAINAALFKLRAGSTSIARLVVTPSRQLRVKNDRTGAFANTGTPLPTGWHTIEFCATVGAGGTLSARLDGTTFASASGQNLGTTPIGSLQLFDDAARTVTANIDDVVVR